MTYRQAVSRLRFARNGDVLYMGEKVGRVIADYAPSGWTFWHEFNMIGRMPKCFNLNQRQGRTLRELKSKLWEALAEELTGVTQ